MYDKEALSYESILTLMESAPANIFFKDTDCRYRFATEMCDMVNGGREHSIIGKTDMDIQKSPEMGRFYYEDDKKILATGKGSCYVNEFSTPNGLVYFEIKKNPVFRDGKIIGIIGVINDVTKQMRLEKELEELSFKDKLTGLYNRNYLEARSRRYVRADDFPTSHIMADCNYLKKVNDTLGHEYGDLLLKRVANAIREAIPESYIPMRVGGDEFLILCPKCTAEMSKETVAKIRACLAAKSDRVLTLSAAFGCYTAEDDSLPFDEALRLADQAMYENKKQMHSAAAPE